MSKTIRIPHSKIDTPDKVTAATEQVFKESGLDCRVNEAVKIDDDFSTKERIFEVKNTQYNFPSTKYSHNFDRINWSTRPSPHVAEG